MSVNPDRAQDVWKDIGDSVSFVVLNLNRADQVAEQQAIRDFAERSQAVIRSLRIRAAADDLKVSIGLSRSAWDWLFPGKPVPAELVDYSAIESGRYHMPATGGDLFLHVRAAEEAVVYECVSQFMLFLRSSTSVLEETKGFRYLEGRAIIGFIDGTEAPPEVDAADYALVGDEDPHFVNGSYAFLQKWLHDMDAWNRLSTEEQERAVGRRKFSDLELADDEKSPVAHNVASKIRIDGVEQKIIRMNVPFSEPAHDRTGTMFIGYSRRWTVTKAMLEQMVTMGDYLLTFSQILTGQLFFIPSRDLLAQIAAGEFTKDSA